MFSTWEVISYIYLPAFLLVMLAVLFIRWRNRGTALRADSEGLPNRDFVRLRQQVLAGLRGKVELPAPWRPEEPYAVLMDWHVGKGIATVVAVGDGSASIYLSSGGGSIGGGELDEGIRNAALRAVSIAGRLQASMQPTKEFPLPAEKQVKFYAVSDAGVFGASASAEDLAAKSHALSQLGEVMQEIITRYMHEAKK